MDSLSGEGKAPMVQPLNAKTSSFQLAISIHCVVRRHNGSRLWYERATLRRPRP
jgi:hypothetical protein